MIDPRGYVHIVGRGKDLVISGGFNVYPKEVESEIDAIEGVVESAVIGVPHPDFGEGVTAVVAVPKGSPLTEREVLARLEGRLAKFKQPKRVIFVEDLPRNAMARCRRPPCARPGRRSTSAEDQPTQVPGSTRIFGSGGSVSRVTVIDAVGDHSTGQRACACSRKRLSVERPKKCMGIINRALIDCITSNMPSRSSV